MLQNTLRDNMSFLSILENSVVQTADNLVELYGIGMDGGMSDFLAENGEQLAQVNPEL